MEASTRNIWEGTRNRPSKWSLLPASPPYFHPCPLESGLKTAIRSCHSQLKTLKRLPFQSKSQSLQWLIWTYHHPDFPSCWALPPTHTTQSQGPLPFCLSLRLLLPEAFSLVALGLERCLPYLHGLNPSLPLGLDANETFSGRPTLSTQLLNEPSPVPLTLLPLLIPLFWSSFP